MKMTYTLAALFTASAAFGANVIVIGAETDIPQNCNGHVYLSSSMAGQDVSLNVTEAATTVWAINNTNDGNNYTTEVNPANITLNVKEGASLTVQQCVTLNATESVTLNIAGNVTIQNNNKLMGDPGLMLGVASDGITMNLNFSNEAKLTVGLANWRNKTNDVHFGVSLTSSQLETLTSTHALTYTFMSEGESWNRECLRGATLSNVASLDDYGMVNLGVLVQDANGVYHSVDVESGTALSTEQIAARTDNIVAFGEDSFAYAVVMSSKSQTLSLVAKAPEPATATLSLLALAGLAARRRRH